MTGLKIIGVASGWGAQDHRCADGPEALRQAGLLARLHAAGVDAAWEDMLFPLVKDTPTHMVSELCARLSGKVDDLSGRGEFPVILGGDHSCAIGTWSGIHHAIPGGGALGLIWIDAHMDSHTPETSPSGALHGMPLACLLGYGLPELTGIAGFPPPIMPQHLCLIGVRSFETGEAALLDRLGVRIFFMEEVHQRGIEKVMADALEIVQRGTAGFGISIDLDVLEPREDPGVGSPAPDGVLGFELVRALKQAKGHPKLLGMEIVEYNPSLDCNQITAQRAIALLVAVVAPGNI